MAHEFSLVVRLVTAWSSRWPALGLVASAAALACSNSASDSAPSARKVFNRSSSSAMDIGLPFKRSPLSISVMS